MRGLRELQLPKLVEARDKQAFPASNTDADWQSGAPLHWSQSSAASDQTSVSPTFPPRCQTKFPSANSSLASSPAMRSSLEDYSPKRPLTDVKEEPFQEKVDEFEMVDASPRDAEPSRVEHHEEISVADFLNRTSTADYDWVDTPPYEASDFDFTVSKRHCAEEPLSPNASQSRISTRFPSLTRKWKHRKEQRNSSVPDSVFDSSTTRSRPSSMKSPSILEAKPDPFDRCDVPIPPTPSQSGTPEGSQNDNNDLVDSPDGLEAEGDDDNARPERHARTPLLPPVMALNTNDKPVQSPLQSPKVVESSSVPQSPFDCPSPYSALPSPPLSTKPSIASFHHRPIVPSSEIPSIRLAEPQDEWASKLGHFNFTIEPEPYSLAMPATLSDCRRLRADWEVARRNYVKHLARAAEIYGTTSTVYRHTEEKWATIDAIWKRSHEQGLASVPQDSQEALQASQHESDQVPSSPAKLPVINGLQSERKFPKVSETGIVGPMEQVRPHPLPRPSRKRAFWKFLQGVLPTSVAFGRSQA